MLKTTVRCTVVFFLHDGYLCYNNDSVKKWWQGLFDPFSV